MLIKRELKISLPETKKLSQALGFSLKAPTLLANKISFKGPVKHNEICNQISRNAADSGFNLTDKDVDYIVKRFFHRLTTHMKDGNYIVLDGFGTLAMSPVEKNARIIRHREKYLKKYELHLKSIERRKKNKNIRLRFKTFNRKRVSLGQKEWTFEDWSKVFKIYRVPRNYRKGRWAKSR